MEVDWQGLIGWLDGRERRRVEKKIGERPSCHRLPFLSFSLSTGRYTRTSSKCYSRSCYLTYTTLVAVGEIASYLPTSYLSTS